MLCGDWINIGVACYGEDIQQNQFSTDTVSAKRKLKLKRIFNKTAIQV